MVGDISHVTWRMRVFSVAVDTCAYLIVQANAHVSFEVTQLLPSDRNVMLGVPMASERLK